MRINNRPNGHLSYTNMCGHSLSMLWFSFDAKPPFCVREIDSRNSCCPATSIVDNCFVCDWYGASNCVLSVLITAVHSKLLHRIAYNQNRIRSSRYPSRSNFFEFELNSNNLWSIHVIAASVVFHRSGTPLCNYLPVPLHWLLFN